MMNPTISLNVKPVEFNKQYRKELLIRQNNGRRAMQNYIKKIKNLFNIKESAIELLGLYESDKIFFNKNFNKKYNVVVEKIYTLDDYSMLYKDFTNLLTEQYCFCFIDYDWKNCGALKLKLDEKLEYNLDFGLKKYQINNEIHLISTDQKTRLLLDYTNSKNESTIELIVYESKD